MLTLVANSPLRRPQEAKRGLYGPKGPLSTQVPDGSRGNIEHRIRHQHQWWVGAYFKDKFACRQRPFTIDHQINIIPSYMSLIYRMMLDVTIGIRAMADYWTSAEPDSEDRKTFDRQVRSNMLAGARMAAKQAKQAYQETCERWQRDCAAEGSDPEEMRDFYQIDELQQRWEEAVIEVAQWEAT
jgi:hypothetical protein